MIYSSNKQNYDLLYFKVASIGFFSLNPADKLSELWLYPIFKHNPQPQHIFPLKRFTKVTRGLLFGVKTGAVNFSLQLAVRYRSVSSLVQNQCYSGSPDHSWSSSYLSLCHQTADICNLSHGWMPPFSYSSSSSCSKHLPLFTNPLYAWSNCGVKSGDEARGETKNIHREGWALESSTCQS